PYIYSDKKELSALRQYSAWQRLCGFRQTQQARDGDISGTNGNGQTYCRVIAGSGRSRKRSAGGLPGCSRLNIFHYAMPVNHKRFKGTQLAIGNARMLKLAELAAHSWHAWQRTAHYSCTLPAANHNSITVIIQLPNRAFFKLRKECHGNIA